MWMEYDVWRQNGQAVDDLETGQEGTTSAAGSREHCHCTFHMKCNTAAHGLWPTFVSATSRLQSSFSMVCYWHVRPMDAASGSARARFR
jgi:hypothetical protein